MDAPNRPDAAARQQQQNVPNPPPAAASGSRLRARPGDMPRQENHAQTAQVFDDALPADARSTNEVDGVRLGLAMRDARSQQAAEVQTIRQSVHNANFKSLSPDAAQPEVRAFLEEGIRTLKGKMESMQEYARKTLVSEQNVPKRLKANEGKFAKIFEKEMGKLEKSNLDRESSAYFEARTRSVKKIFSTFKKQTGENETMCRLCYNRQQKVIAEGELERLEGDLAELNALRTTDVVEPRTG